MMNPGCMSLAPRVPGRKVMPYIHIREDSSAWGLNGRIHHLHSRLPEFYMKLQLYPYVIPERKSDLRDIDQGDNEWKQERFCEKFID